MGAKRPLSAAILCLDAPAGDCPDREIDRYFGERHALHERALLLETNVADLQQVCRDMFWFLVADGDVFGCACEKPIEKADDECPPCRCRRVGAASGAFGPHEKAELASQRKRLNYVPKKGVR